MSPRKGRKNEKTHNKEFPQSSIKIIKTIPPKDTQARTMSGQDGDSNKTILGKTLTFNPKVALVKPSGGTGGKTTTVSAVGQPQQAGATTYRTINQSHMRLVMPASGPVPSSQIIQTHLMPQAMVKQGRPCHTVWE